MKSVIALTLGIIVGLAIVGVARANGSARPISVDDMVGYSFIGDPNKGYDGGIDVGYNEGQLIYDDAASVSPDERYFAVIVRRGDIADDETKARLEVFETGSVFKGDTRPRLVASFVSTGVRPPTYSLHWLGNSRKLLFIAEKPDDPPEVYMADMAGGAVRAITQVRRGVVKFDATPTGSTLALLVPDDTFGCRASGAGQKHGYTLAADGLIDAITGKCQLDFFRQSEHLYVQRQSGSAAEIPDPGNVSLLGRSGAEFRIERCDPMMGGVSISPDGRFAVRTCGISRVPDRWSRYVSTDMSVGTSLRGNLSFALKQELQGRVHGGTDGGTLLSLFVQQDVIFDLSTGEAALAWDAPLVPGTADMIHPRAWVGDTGHRLALAGVLVQESGGGWGRDGRFGPAVVVVDAKTGERQIVSENGSGVAGVAWSPAHAGLVVDYGPDPTNLGGSANHMKRIFRMRQGRWGADGTITETQDGGGGVQVKIEQSLNHWPVLVATQVRSGKKVTVLDPDSWLQDRALAKERKFQWSSDGYTFEGGLYYPLNYSPKVRYPLIIQTHGFGPWFSLYGNDSSGCAAQPLAAHGFLVAQIGQVVREPSGRKVQDRLKLFSIEVQGLIGELARRRMIDSSRVGITGWSSFWLPVENMLVFSGLHFAAAVDADGADAGYFMYTASDIGRGFGDAQWGSPPSRRGLRHWLQVVPDFNLERVRTPALVLAPGSIGLQENWEFFARLRQLGKPVEMFYMPSGAHEIIQPWYWAASAQRVVDWYRFWLQGEEDRSPDKAAQYRRWESFCAKERQQLQGRQGALHCPHIAGSRRDMQ